MDPETENLIPSVDVDKPVEPTIVKENEKTEQLVNDLENQVDKAYSTIQDSTLTNISKIQGMVNEKLPELQNKLKLDLDNYVKKEDLENLKERGGQLFNKASENTNKVLDNIDQDLEKFENITLEYAQQIGGQIGSIWKSASETVSNATSNKSDNTKKDDQSSGWNWSGWGKQLTEIISGGDSVEEVLEDEKKTELVYCLPKDIVSGSRAESQIHELQSDKVLYLNAAKSKEFKDYSLTEKDETELKEILGNETLYILKLYKEVVGNQESGKDKDEKLESNDFWKIYFGKKAQILDAEKKRRALLEKEQTVNDEEEEDFDWDEEEE